LLVILATALFIVSTFGCDETSAENETINCRYKGSCGTGGSAGGVALVGDYAYVADTDDGLVIVDVTDKTDPQQVGYHDTAYARDVAVAGDYAYVADYTNGLVIVDISDKTKPQQVGHYDTAGWALGVEVVGAHAYVADWSNGLVIVDITDETDPQEIGHYDTAGQAGGVAVTGDYAYVADNWNGLVIVDISDKSDPQRVGHYDTDDDAGDVSVIGDYAYVADGDNGLVIVDISDKTDPQRVGHHDTAYARGVVVAGDYAYIAASSNGLIIMNISDKANPRQVGRYDTDQAKDAAMAEDYSYITDGTDGLVVVELAPVAWVDDISPNPAFDTDEVSFSGHGSDDSSIEGYSWRSSRDGPLSSSSSFATSSLSQGSHTISFKVKDDYGVWSDEVSTTLVIHERPVAYIDTISPNPALDTDTVRFSGHGTDDGSIQRYIWTSSLDGELHNGSSPNFATNIQTVDDFEDGEQTFSTGGDANWSLGDCESNCVVSGDISDNEESWIKNDFTGPGTLEFRWKVSSEDTYDILRLYLNGVFQDGISGEAPWSWYSLDLPIGTNTVQWVYEKDGAVTHGNDTAYLDDILYTCKLSLSNGTHSIYFRVQDNYGVWSNEEATTLSIKGKPRAYIDTVSPNPALDTDEVTFSGHGSDDGSIKEYSWRSSKDGSLNTSSSFATFSLSPGNHTIYFKAKDDHDVWSDEASTTLVIHERPVAYIDVISPNPCLDTDEVSLSGHGSDDGSIVGYSWRSSKDGSLNTSSSFATFSLSPGNHTIHFKVKDDHDVWSDEVSDFLIVHVRPTAFIDSIAPNPVLKDRNVLFQGHGTDDGMITRYAWRSSLEGQLYNGTNTSFSCDTLLPGTHSIYFRVQDNHGIWSKEVLGSLTVLSRPHAHVDFLSPSPAFDTDTVTFSGHGTDDGIITRYVWRSNLDGELYNSTVGPFSTDELTLGTHSIYFKVQDNHGLWSEEILSSLTILSRPHAHIDSISPDFALVGDEITFEGHGTDGGTIERYVWRSSHDNEFYNGTEATFNYSGLSTGTHTIYFRVKDKYGVWSDEDSSTLSIHPNQPDSDVSFSGNIIFEYEGAKLKENTEVTIDILLQNTGDGRVEDLSVELYIDYSLYKVFNFDLESGESRYLSEGTSAISWLPTIAGTYSIKLMYFYSHEGEDYVGSIETDIEVVGEKESSTPFYLKTSFLGISCLLFLIILGGAAFNLKSSRIDIAYGIVFSIIAIASAYLVFVSDFGDTVNRLACFSFFLIFTAIYVVFWYSDSSEREKERLAHQRAKEEILQAKNYETSRRYEDAARIYEKCGLWKEAGRVRELKEQSQAVRQSVITGPIDMSTQVDIKNSVVQRSNVGTGILRNCHVCGQTVDISKTPTICPHCKNQLR